MEIIQITSADDPRLQPFTGLKDKLSAKRAGMFIAEGEMVVQKLLKSSYKTHAILLSKRRAKKPVENLQAGVAIYCLEDEMMERIVGFKFNRGIMACGLRAPQPEIHEILENSGPVKTVAVCPELNDATNLGLMIRHCAAFGVTALFLGQQSCDPFSRRVIRVSIGSTFFLPVCQPDDLFSSLKQLQEDGFELYATVLDQDVKKLQGVKRGKKLALLFGNEGRGLSLQFQDICGERITIGMPGTADSLNVSTAAAIFLYHFSQQENFR
ncbi:TrmH family RNA methyltransferase [Candidatus Riflebacteria bacterium]